MASEKEQLPEGFTIAFKPYLVRALIDWIEDNGLHPYLVAKIDDRVEAPREYADENGFITLNVKSEAIGNASFANDEIAFQARFGEDNRIRQIRVPMGAVVAVFPAENPSVGAPFPYEPAEAPEEGAEKPAEAAPAAPAARRPSFIQKVK